MPQTSKKGVDSSQVLSKIEDFEKKFVLSLAASKVAVLSATEGVLIITGGPDRKNHANQLYT